ncbi:MAG: ABC transporter permease subunit, partial [Halobacteriaceae archaeon]
GIAAVLLATSIGTLLGAIAGYVGGWVDEVIMRVVDILYAFPFLVLAIGLVAILGEGLQNIIIALTLIGWITFARVVR